MKKTVSVILAVLLCITLAGCSVSESTQRAPAGESTLSSQSRETASEARKETETKKNKNFSDKSVTKPSEKKTDNKGDEKSPEKSSEKGTKSTAKSSTAPAKTTAEPSASVSKPESVGCSVTIECKSILDNMEDLKPGHESFVPQNGIIMRRTAVTVKNGSTAYDALKAACDRQGVTMNVSGSVYGKYIVGFNNIDEKDCGKQSGWTYKVNDKSIWQSCDKYVVQDGDVIEFSFVCKY